MTNIPLLRFSSKPLSKRNLSELPDDGHEVSLLYQENVGNCYIKYYMCDHCQTIFAFRTFFNSTIKHLAKLIENRVYTDYDRISCNDTIIREIIE